MPAGAASVLEAEARRSGTALLLRLVRPVAVVPVFVVALMMSLIAAGAHPGAAAFARGILAAAILSAVTVVGDTLNQVSDVAEDAVHPTKQDRVVPGGEVSPFRTTAYCVLAWLVAVVIGLLLLTPTFVFLLVLVLIFVWLYTFGRWKERLGLNQLALSTPRGALGFAAAWSVNGPIIAHGLWVVLAVTVPYVLMANEVRNLGDDREADLSAGVQNITTVWGEGAGRAVTLAGLLWPVLPLLSLGLYRSNPGAWLLAVPGIAGIVGYRRWPPFRLWAVFYAGLGLIPVVFALGLFVFGSPP